MQRLMLNGSGAGRPGLPGARWGKPNARVFPKSDPEAPRKNVERRTSKPVLEWRPFSGASDRVGERP